MLARGKRETHQLCLSAFISITFSSGPLEALLDKKQRHSINSRVQWTCFYHVVPWASWKKCPSDRSDILRRKILLLDVRETCSDTALLTCFCQFTFTQLFMFPCLEISCVASAPCQYPCKLVLGHTLTHTCTRHQAAGRRQLCSLKRKVNSCVGDSWSSHDIPSPNIRDGLGRSGASAERGSIYNLDEMPRL